MPPKLKIALHVTSLQLGGAERVTVNLAEGLASHGHEVDLVFLDRGNLPDDALPTNVRLIKLNAYSMVSSIRPLATYLKQNKPEVIISALHQPGIATIFARSLSRSKTKVIVAIHSTISQEVKNADNYRQKIMPLFTKAFYPKADGIICVSESAAHEASIFLRIHPSEIKTIYNPVILPRFFELVQDEPDHPWLKPEIRDKTIIAVGRLSKVKNFPLLLNALKIARTTHDIRLIIVGEGPDRKALETLCNELELNDFVDFPGFKQNPYCFLKNSRLFALTSLYEGLPTVLIESLAAGTPVVSVDCVSGPKEILQNGKFGHLVPNSDPVAFANAIIDELNQPKIPPVEESWTPYLLETATRKYEEYILQVLSGN